MRDLFIPYELALLAKEKGFEETCLAYYSEEGEFIICAPQTAHWEMKGVPKKECSAPLYQQIVDWFREHAIIVDARPKGLISYYAYVGRIGNMSNEQEIYKDEWSGISNYYLALNEAITEAFKLIS